MVGTCGKASRLHIKPRMSLKQEGISYLAGAELPCLLVNVMRGGPDRTIQPSQADYFQTVKVVTWRLQIDYASPQLQ